MQYHAVVHNNENKSVFECLVIAESTDSARRKIQDYFWDKNQREEAKMIITLSDKRTNNKSGLLLIE